MSKLPIYRMDNIPRRADLQPRFIQRCGGKNPQERIHRGQILEDRGFKRGAMLVRFG